MWFKNTTFLIWKTTISVGIFWVSTVIKARHWSLFGRRTYMQGQHGLWKKHGKDGRKKRWDWNLSTQTNCDTLTTRHVWGTETQTDCLLFDLTLLIINTVVLQLICIFLIIRIGKILILRGNLRMRTLASKRQNQRGPDRHKG